MADKKFIASSSLDDIEILTDTGWVEAAAIHKTVPYRKWLVKTNKRELECADDHIVFRPGYQEVFVKDLAIGDAILTEDGTELVVSIHESTTIENMYDVELPAGTNHRYYTNGILSHNTTTYTIFVLWYAMFYSEKRIMICANKLQTAIEIMDRIRLAYEYLPKWIKAAITVYNKQEITFSNNSSIRAFATSSAAARGFTCNCVDGSTKVTVRLFGFLKLSLPIKFLRWLGVNTLV